MTPSEFPLKTFYLNWTGTRMRIFMEINSGYQFSIIESRSFATFRPWINTIAFFLSYTFYSFWGVNQKIPTQLPSPLLCSETSKMITELPIQFQILFFWWKIIQGSTFWSGISKNNISLGRTIHSISTILFSSPVSTGWSLRTWIHFSGDSVWVPIMQHLWIPLKL